MSDIESKKESIRKYKMNKPKERIFDHFTISPSVSGKVDIRKDCGGLDKESRDRIEDIKSDKLYGDRGDLW